MLTKIATALDKAANFISASINKLSGLTKPRKKFFSWMFERWLMLPTKYNFLKFSRYGGYSKKLSVISSAVNFLLLNCLSRYLTLSRKNTGLPLSIKRIVIKAGTKPMG